MDIDKTDQKLILSAFGVAVLAGIFMILPRQTTGPDTPTEAFQDIPTIDTFIPVGYTLVPIDIQNHESLDSVLGSYGMVDLYTADQKGRPEKIAERLKILRSPKNPQVFAVLIKEESAHTVAGHAGPIFVTVVSKKPSRQAKPDKYVKPKRFSIQEEG